MGIRVASVVFVSGDGNEYLKTGHFVILREVLMLSGGRVGLNRVLVRMRLFRHAEVLQRCQSFCLDTLNV